MENITDNLISYSPRKIRHARFSVPGIPSDRRSICSMSLGQSTDGNSSDAEWARIENNILENNRLAAELEEEIRGFEEEDMSIVRALTFDSPLKKRLSLSTIQSQKEELALVKRSMELDEEIEFLDANLDAIEENFKSMFVEITTKRALAILAKKTDNPKLPVIDCYQLLEDLNLTDRPYIEWAAAIEKAIFDKIIQ